jgi:selenocysteine lyase/cysteine desulfurase
MTMTGIDVTAMRALTPGCAQRVHLNNAGAGLLSEPTLTAITDHLRLEAEIGGYEAAARAQAAIDATYQALARLVGGRPEQIALFDNATHAWNAAFYSVPFRPGDRILTGRWEYGSNFLAFLQMAQRTGAEIVLVPDDERGQLDVDALEARLDDRTRVVNVVHMPTSGGLVNPAEEVGRVLADTDALFILDATQTVGQLPIDVTRIGCDLLTGAGRKFLRGPRGTGFLWVSDVALDQLEPYVAEIRSATWDGARGFNWAPAARRFETWENSYANLIGLGTAVQQALDIGLDAIAERTRTLAEHLRGSLDVLPGVSTHDLGPRLGAIVTAKLNSVDSAHAAAALGQTHINVSTTVPEHNQFDTEQRGVHPLIRLSPHYYNTTDELDRTVTEIASLSRGS